MRFEDLEKLPIFREIENLTIYLELGESFVLSADTGAGKSVGIGIAALMAGVPTLIVQPRVPNATQLAQTVAKLHGSHLGEAVGLFTGDQKRIARNTKVVYATDGAVLASLGKWQGWNLVIDEIHEWSIGTEVLASLTREFRMVAAMSATMQSDKIASYLGAKHLIHVEGRAFPVEEYANQGNLGRNIDFLLRKTQGSILVFLPGKSEIADSICEMRKYLANCGWEDVHLLPLHAEVEGKDFDLCFDESKQKVVFATDVAATGITPPIKGVIDKGERKEMVLTRGVRSLVKTAVPLSEKKQRRGRAGRLEPGAYIDMCLTPASERRDYGTPQIQSAPLEATLLRLKGHGIDLEELNLFHPLPQENLDEAIQTLKTLECISPEGEITDRGKKVSRSPMGVRAGIIALGDRNGILSRWRAAILAVVYENDFVHNKDWSWKGHGQSLRSDIVHKTEILLKILRKEIPKSQFYTLGIVSKKIRACEVALKKMGYNPKKQPEEAMQPFSTEEVDAALWAIYYAHKDCIYEKSARGYVHITKNGYQSGPSRKLARESVLTKPHNIVAVPLNLGTMKLLSNASMLPPDFEW